MVAAGDTGRADRVALRAGFGGVWGHTEAIWNAYRTCTYVRCGWVDYKGACGGGRLRNCGQGVELAEACLSGSTIAVEIELVLPFSSIANGVLVPRSRVVS